MRTVSANEFRNWLQKQQQSIDNAYKEIEQIQAEYQGSYTRFKASHDQMLQTLANQVESQPGLLPPALQQQVDARTPIEHKAITDRIAALEGQEIPPLQKQMDDLIHRGQEETANLRDKNPQLNEREEAYKNDIANWQGQLNELDKQLAQLRKGLGFILHAWKIHELDRERYRIAGRLDVLNSQVNQVRVEWQDLHDKVVKDQADLQTQWQALAVQLGQLEQERDYMAQDVDALVRHRALVYVFDNLKTPVPGAPPALDANLKQMIQLNIATDDFQAALGSVAGILGIAKGVDEGLNRMSASVQSLIDEQTKNSAYLPALKIALPDTAVAFGAAWDDLTAQSRDEKKLADHPADFTAALKPFLDNNLSSDRIAGFFNALGDALTAATQSWRSA